MINERRVTAQYKANIPSEKIHTHYIQNTNNQISFN